MSDTTDRSAALLEEIVAEILDLDELADDPEWDTYALTAEVMDDAAVMSAFRYAGEGLPEPSDTPSNSDPMQALRESARDADGRTWDVMVLKIHRDSGQVAVEFYYGDEAQRWVSNHENYQRLAYELRPTAADFDEPIV